MYYALGSVQGISTDVAENLKRSKEWMMLIKKLLLALAAVSFLVTPASAADFPSGPVTYMIPFNAGGESDIFARAQQPLLEKALGQSVVITYLVGGGGAVGWKELIRQKPDGYYTAGFNLPHVILQPLQRKKAGYTTDQIKPVMLFMSTPNALVVPKDSPYKTLDDLLKAAKEKPGSVVLGGSGSQTANHLGVVRLNKMAGVNISYIPGTGTGDMISALLGKHVNGLMTYTTVAKNYANDVRTLAVATPERLAVLPDVPTFKELGYDLQEGAYRGLAVPPGTPDDVVQKLYEACKQVNNDPEFKQKMDNMGFFLIDKGPAESVKFIEELTPIYKGILEELKK